MAAVKLNVLHWHLSDDQGFRVESRRYPALQRQGLRRALLHAGADPGRDRLRGGSWHPRRPRVRRAGALDRVVRGPSRARDGSRTVRDRAALGDLPARDGPDEGDGLSAARRLLRRDGGALPGQLLPHRRGRGEGRGLGRLAARQRVQEAQGLLGEPRPPGLLRRADLADRDAPRQADDGLGRDPARAPAEADRRPGLARAGVARVVREAGLPQRAQLGLLRRPALARGASLRRRSRSPGAPTHSPTPNARASWVARRPCGRSS